METGALNSQCKAVNECSLDAAVEDRNVEYQYISWRNCRSDVSSELIINRLRINSAKQSRKTNVALSSIHKNML